MNVYFTSDLHMYHNKPFIYEPRGFSSTEEMVEAEIERWNEIIKNEDIVYVLGDCILNDNELGIKALKQLKGHKHLIFGNHDTNSRIKLYKDNEIFESMQYAMILKSGKKSFYLSHYPTLCQNHDNTAPYNLCGHSHYLDKFQDMELGCYHVECDAHNCTPVSIEEIKKDIVDWNNKNLTITKETN